MYYILDDKTITAIFKSLKMAGAEEFISALPKNEKKLLKVQEALRKENLFMAEETVALFQKILNDEWSRGGFKEIKTVTPERSKALYKQVETATQFAVDFCLDFEYDLVTGFHKFCHHFTTILKRRNTYFKWGIFSYYTDEILQMEDKAVRTAQSADLVNELGAAYKAQFGGEVKLGDKPRLERVAVILSGKKQFVSPAAYMKLMAKKFEFLPNNEVSVGHVTSQNSIDYFNNYYNHIFKD